MPRRTETGNPGAPNTIRGFNEAGAKCPGERMGRIAWLASWAMLQ